MSQFRIKLEFVTDAPENVSQVRERLKAICDPQHPLYGELQRLLGPKSVSLLACYSASYNTRFGKKP